MLKKQKIAILMLIAFLLPSILHANDQEFENFFGDESSSDIAMIDDPYEGFNRTIHDFNSFLDDAIISHASDAYRFLVPSWGRRKITNFMSNINEPVTFVNSILQGDDINSFTSLWRFIINSSIGLAGTFDAADAIGLKKRSEDFGQTLATWGWENSNYLVLPLFGPSTTRDAIGGIVDRAFEPETYIAANNLIDDAIIYSATGLRIINTRANLETQINALKSSLDPYSVVKSAYIQSKNKMIDNAE